MTERDDVAGAVCEWDVVNWWRAVQFWEANSHVCADGATYLEIGSRHGGLALWAALKGGRVLCTDLNGPSEVARRKHENANVTQLIGYGALDACDMRFESRFDIIMFKSVLGGVGAVRGQDGQKLAISEMFRALKPGGELLFAENLVGSPFHRAARKVFVPWGGRWRYVALHEVLGFLENFSEIRYRTFGFLGTFGRSERQRSVLGHADRLGIDRLVPPCWRYIIACVARKAG